MHYIRWTLSPNLISSKVGKSEISADPLTAAKLPAGIDQSKEGSIHDITFYIVIVHMNDFF